MIRLRAFVIHALRYAKRWLLLPFMRGALMLSADLRDACLRAAAAHAADVCYAAAHAISALFALRQRMRTPCHVHDMRRYYY